MTRIDNVHNHWMRQALALAKQAGMETSPNPRVGCVLVKDGHIIGEGRTQAVGQAHAEVMALRDAVANGENAEASIAYVTLEPCSHFGRTPPCANALIEAGVAQVVIALRDPNPLVAGKGIELLQAAGVSVIEGVMENEAREVNLGFLSRMERGRPWVRVKLAASLDGQTALQNGQSQWITSLPSRRDGHAWRARADVILTGSGTILADNPILNVRDLAVPSQPQRWVLDTRLSIPTHYRIFQSESESGQLVLVHDQELSPPNPKKVHVNYLGLPTQAGHIDLQEVMKKMVEQQVNTVHVEAGARLHTSLMQADLIDEWLIYLAPKLIGPGRGLIEQEPLQDLKNACQLEFKQVEIIEDGLRIIARKLR